MIPIDYTNLNRLDWLWVTSFVSIFSITYSRIKHVKGDYVMALFGAILCTFGLCSLICETIFKPLTFAGGLTYAIVGFLLCLYMSDEVRYYILKTIFPRDFLQLLHEKPLIDILMESAPSSKIYILIALSSFLSKNELNRMINTLPAELDYVRQPGIVHLLPSPLKNLLSKTANISSNYLLIEDSGNIINDTTNVQTVLNDDNFEEALANIIQSRSVEIVNQVKNSVLNKLGSTLFYMLQGGDISKSTLLKTFGVTTMITTVASYRQFNPNTYQILKPIDNCCKALSVGCGAMLLFREIYSINRNHSSNQNTLTSYFLKFYNFVIKGLIEAKIKITNDSVVASFCVISCALSVVLGYRLRANNFKEIKWIYDILSSRLIQFYKNMITQRE
jgi:hypothetical protein